MKELIGSTKENQRSSVIRQKDESHNENFPKNEHFLPPDKYTRVCVLGVKNVRFSEIWRTLFSCNTRFEIRTFALMPTSYSGR